MKAFVLAAGVSCAAVIFLAEGSINAAINVRGPKVYRYSETRLLAKTIRANQFVVQGKKDPTEVADSFCESDVEILSRRDARELAGRKTWR